jgi:hypothetical protein
VKIEFVNKRLMVSPASFVAREKRRCGKQAKTEGEINASQGFEFLYLAGRCDFLRDRKSKCAAAGKALGS